MKQRWMWTLVTGMVLAGTFSAPAADKKTGAPDKPMPRRSVVWLVDQVKTEGVSLTRSDLSGTTNLMVTTETQVFVNGPLGKLTGVKPGMRAEFTITDSGAVTRLAFFDYTPPTEAPHIEKAAKPAKAQNPGRNKKAK